MHLQRANTISILLFCKCPLQLHPYFAIPLCECSVLLQYVVWMQLHIAFPCNCTLQFTSTTAFYNPIVQLRPAIAFSNPHLRLAIAIHISDNILYLFESSTWFCNVPLCCCIYAIVIRNLSVQPPLQTYFTSQLCNCNMQFMLAIAWCNSFLRLQFATPEKWLSRNCILQTHVVSLVQMVLPLNFATPLIKWTCVEILVFNSIWNARKELRPHTFFIAAASLRVV